MIKHATSSAVTKRPADPPVNFHWNMHNVEDISKMIRPQVLSGMRLALKSGRKNTSGFFWIWKRKKHVSYFSTLCCTFCCHNGFPGCHMYSVSLIGNTHLILETVASWLCQPCGIDWELNERKTSKPAKPRWLRFACRGGSWLIRKSNTK